VSSGLRVLSSYFTWLALFLLCTMVAGLVRILRGPKPADRMLGIQFSGTTSVAVLLLLAQAAEDDALRNVALVFMLLALMVLIAFVAKAPPGDVGNGD
jgi:multicomponent Na+:H+ antiporter subunit F